MRPVFAAVLSIGLLAPAALAADDILTLRNDKVVVGQIKALDEKGVTIVTAGGEARYDWDALLPRCQYEIRSERLGESDPAGHAALADFCLNHRLFAEARREANVAKALGYPDPRVLEAFVETVNREEAEFTFATVEQLVAEEDFEAAREEIRRFLRQAPVSDDTDRARAMVADLIRRRDAQILREEEDRKAAADLEKKEQLAQRIDALLEEAGKARDAAAAAYGEAVQYHTVGNVTRARKAYEAAEQQLFRAHHVLSRLQRLVRSGATFDKASDEKSRIRARLVEVYLGLARLLVEQRNYKRGMPYVLKVLFLDPVNGEALGLRDDVESRWLRTSARRLTNTPGVRVTSGANR